MRCQSLIFLAFITSACCRSSSEASGNESSTSSLCRAAIRSLEMNITSTRTQKDQSDDPSGVGAHRHNTGGRGDQGEDGGSLVLFLHIPRVAGKTLHSCFLKPALPSAAWCPPSYRCGYMSLMGVLLPSPPLSNAFHPLPSPKLCIMHIVPFDDCRSDTEAEWR